MSLTFGGRPNVGTGFGIPIVLRYVLQTSDAIDAAVDALTRIPVHMRLQRHCVGRRGAPRDGVRRPGPARSSHRPGRTTNHQGKVEWKPYAAAIRSVERSDRLDALLAGGADTATVVALRCCASPCTRRNSTKDSARSTPPSTVQARARDLPLARAHLGALNPTASPRRQWTCWSAMTAPMPAPRSASTGCHTWVGFSGDRSCWRTDRGASVGC